jgi:hypothetical protein
VRAAYAEARVGVSISLNASLDLVKVPGRPRAPTSHKVLSWAEDLAPSTCGHLTVLDDELSFNTQASSQWDGFCHYAHQSSGQVYNGSTATKAARKWSWRTSIYRAPFPAAKVLQLCHKTHTVSFAKQLLTPVPAVGDPELQRGLPGLEHWHKRGGLVGRGVLLDYYAYARTQGITYEPFSRHAIGIEDLEKVAQFQGTELRKGDILIVRAGVAETLEALSGEEQLSQMMKGQGGMVGVEGSEEAAKVRKPWMAKKKRLVQNGKTPGLLCDKWFWDKHFAAVAGDMFAFEVYPPQKLDGSLGDMGDLGKSLLSSARLWGIIRWLNHVAVLHPYFLAMFGLNIGELWNLKALGEYCAKIGRYSFLLTSAPLNISGLVASPPNALALF